MLPHQRFTRVGPRRLVVVLLAITFFAELGEMFLLPSILPNRLSRWVPASIDALLLVLIMAPAVWWLLIQPLRDEREEAESRFRDLIESSPEGILAVDQRGLIRLLSAQAEELFGYSRAELVGQPVEMLMPGMVRARHVADRTQFQRQPRVRPMGTGRDLRALRKDGSEFPVEVSLSPVSHGGEPLVIATVRDVTRRQEAERALRESEQRYRAVVQHIDEIVYAVEMTADPSAGRVVFVSDRVERVTGHTSQEFLENPQLWSSLIHPDDASSVASLTDRLLSERASVTRVYRLRDDRTGHYLWIEDRVAPHVAEDGALVTLFGVARDVTERQRAAQLLAEQSKILESFFKYTQTCLVFLDKKFNFIRVNDAYAKACQRDISEFAGRNHFELYPSDAKAEFERVIRTKEPFQAFARSFTFPDHLEWGTTYWDLTLVPILDDRGEVECLVFSLSDVTERKRAEDALREAEQRLRAVVSSAPITIFATDRRGVFTLSEGKNLQRVGLKTGENVGVSAFELYGSLPIVEETGAVTTGEAVLRRVLAGETVTGFTELRGVYFANHFVPVRDADGQVVGVVGVAMDTTDRRRAEVALRQSEADLKEAQRVGKLGSWEWNVKTDTITWSVEYYRIYGRDPTERPPGYEEHLRLYTAESAARLSAAVERAMQTGAPYEVELEQAHTDGTKAWVTARGEVTRDASGQIVGLRGTAQDISDSKRAEDVLQQANTRLQKLSRRLLTIQETERRSLARELHDEIGQALTATKINLQALERFPDAATLASRLRDANSIVERALEQVRSLSLELRPPLLDDLGLPAALRWLLDQHARRSDLQVQFVSDQVEGRFTAEVETACFRIAQQAFANVVKHAGARAVTVELRRGGDALHLHVRDDGAGFDVPAAHARAVHGESLGLLSMEERAALAGGSIEWASAPGQGTNVHAWFALAPTTKP